MNILGGGQGWALNLTPNQHRDQQQKHDKYLAEITPWAANYMQDVVCCWSGAFLGYKDRKDILD